jgi:hypothetical protein
MEILLSWIDSISESQPPENLPSAAWARHRARNFSPQGGAGNFLALKSSECYQSIKLLELFG